MKSFPIPLLLLGCLLTFGHALDNFDEDDDDDRLEGVTSEENRGNLTLDQIITMAMKESDHEIVQSYTPSDFLFNSCQDKKYEPTKEMSQIFPYYLSGFDAESRPIWIGEAGKYDLNRLTSRGQQGIDEIEAYAREVIVNFIRSFFMKPTPGRPAFQFIFIIDLEGFKADQVTVENVHFVRKLAKRYLRLIDEYAYALVLINGNEIAEKLAKIAAPVFDGHMESVAAFGTNKKEWLPYLQQLVPKDQIPSWYGGSNKNFKPFRIFP